MYLRAFLCFFILSINNIFASTTPVNSSNLIISKFLGVSDIITGLWLGAVILILIRVTIKWIEKANLLFPAYKLAVITFFISLIGLLYMGENPKVVFMQDTIMWIDSFIFAVGFGAVIMNIFSRPYYIENEHGEKRFPIFGFIFPIIGLLLGTVLLMYLGF